MMKRIFWIRWLIFCICVMCKTDTASSFDEAKELLEKYKYDITILDIMGVKGFELLEIVTQSGITDLNPLSKKREILASFMMASPE